MAKFSVVVMKPGIKTAGGLIYPKEVVEKAVKDFKKSKEDLKFKILNVSKEVFNIDFLEEAAFSDNVSSSKMEYTDDGIKISFNLNKKTEEYKMLTDNTCIGFLSGIGEVNNDNTVSDYEIQYIVIIPRETLDEKENPITNKVIEE